MATTKTPVRRAASVRAARPGGVHRGAAVPPAPPLSAQQRRELEDVDHLLATLIKQNRQLRTRIDRLARALTSVGEDQVDSMLRAVRKRLRERTRAIRPVRKATARRRVLGV